MSKGLENFNLLCENIQLNILDQKRHSFLHNLRPWARRKKYIQQDFMTLWNKSCFDKLKGALLGTNIDFNLKQIKVPNGQRDIYQGTDRPGVFLRYKIYQKDQKKIISTILTKLKRNSDSDDLATWRAYIQDQIAQCQAQKKQFDLPMQLQIISRIKPKQNQSFQSKKIQQISQFNFAGFDGNIYLWLDLSKFKDQIKDALEKNKQKTQEQDQNQNYVLQQNDNTNQAQDSRQINLHLTSPIQDKILLGSFTINIVESNKMGLLELGGKILVGHAPDLIGNGLVSIFNKVNGTSKVKDTTEQPKLIRKHLGLLSTDKPYVQVKSTVTLKDWLYDIQQMPQRKYLGKDGGKQNVSGLTKFPFILANIKHGFNPLEITDLSQKNNCWAVGNFSGTTRWEKDPITIAWLANRDIRQHLITLRFQSWIKRNNGYYFDYRFVFNFNGFYTIGDKITQLQIEKRNIENAIRDRHKGKEAEANNELNNMLKYRNLNEHIKSLQNQQQNFAQWFNAYITQMQKYRPDEFTRASVDKIIYNNKNQMVGRDSHIQSSFQAFKQRDISGFKFLIDVLRHFIKDCTIEGKNISDIMKDI